MEICFFVNGGVSWKIILEIGYRHFRWLVWICRFFVLILIFGGLGAGLTLFYEFDNGTLQIGANFIAYHFLMSRDFIGVRT